ncbi:MAG: hypothetical protein Q8J80_11655 [Gallionella sp.]|nr:hypothetical protein [Gallionella sp.]
MQPYFKDNADSILMEDIRQRMHDEGASSRSLCAAVVISSCAVLPDEATLLALLNDPDDSGTA